VPSAASSTTARSGPHRAHAHDRPGRPPRRPVCRTRCPPVRQRRIRRRAWPVRANALSGGRARLPGSGPRRPSFLSAFRVPVRCVPGITVPVVTVPVLPVLFPLLVLILVLRAVVPVLFLQPG